MPARPDPYIERLLEKVTEKWQPLEPLLVEAIPLVPPGKAMRRYEKRGKSTGIRPLTEEEKRISGARSLVTDAINIRRKSRLEVETMDGQRQIRWKPLVPTNGRCPTCGRGGESDVDSDFISELIRREIERIKCGPPRHDHTDEGTTDE